MTTCLCPLAPAVIAAIALAAGHASAQQPPPPQPAQAAAAAPTAAPAFERILLTAGRSTVLTTDFDITRTAVTNPAVADAVVVQPREVLVDGKGPGTVSLIIWGAGVRRQYDVVVDAGVSQLQQQLQALFPGEDIRVSATDDALLLSGRVSNTAAMLRAGEIAKASAPKAQVMNLLQVPGAGLSQQVMLQVRFAEVNRKAVTELGATLFTSPLGYHNNLGSIGTQQFVGPSYSDLQKTTANGELASVDGKLTFSDFLNLFIMNWKYDVGALIRALKSKGYFQSLAEPNLIAYNGQEASFLAGGEFPVPVVQGVSGAVQVQWKEFGVKLKFTPTIAGDAIRLKVEPEVSSLDFNNGITLQGFRIPALITRKAHTDVELRDGQSFAIAGLLHNSSQDNTAAIPILSSLPIIGNLFKSKAETKEQTELMVIITPQLVRPLEPDEVPPLPTSPRRFLPGHGIGSELQGGGGLVDAPAIKPKSKDKQEPRKQ